MPPNPIGLPLPIFKLDFAPDQLKNNSRDCYIESYDNHRILDISIMSTSVLIYLIVIVLIVKRRELQPIKLKGWRLIIISLIGSGFLFISDFLGKIFKSYLIENNEITKMWPLLGEG